MRKTCARLTMPKQLRSDKKELQASLGLRLLPSFLAAVRHLPNHLDTSATLIVLAELVRYFSGLNQEDCQQV
jgi:hypothetical protein